MVNENTVTFLIFLLIGFTWIATCFQNSRLHRDFSARFPEDARKHLDITPGRTENIFFFLRPSTARFIKRDPYLCRMRRHLIWLYILSAAIPLLLLLTCFTIIYLAYLTNHGTIDPRAISLRFRGIVSDFHLPRSRPSLQMMLSFLEPIAFCITTIIVILAVRKSTQLVDRYDMLHSSPDHQFYHWAHRHPAKYLAALLRSRKTSIFADDPHLWRLRNHFIRLYAASGVGLALSLILLGVNRSM